jgi:hypothetical protein
MDFQLGLAAILLYGLLFIPLNPRTSAAGLFAYFFLGLLMMSAARISGVANFRGGRLARLGKGWIAGVLASAAAVIVVSLLLGLLASSYAGEILARVVLAILALIGLVIVIILFGASPARCADPDGAAQLRDLMDSEALRNIQNLLTDLRQRSLQPHSAGDGRHAHPHPTRHPAGAGAAGAALAATARREPQPARRGKRSRPTSRQPGGPAAPPGRAG